MNDVARYIRSTNKKSAAFQNTTKFNSHSLVYKFYPNSIKIKLPTELLMDPKRLILKFIWKNIQDCFEKKYDGRFTLYIKI